jgi:poly-gamma-glutamate synthesis protein (capsule biosynthesis protein)
MDPGASSIDTMTSQPWNTRRVALAAAFILLFLIAASGMRPVASAGDAPAPSDSPIANCAGGSQSAPLTFTAAAAGDAAAVPAAPPPPSRLVVAGGGDIILHGRCHLSAEQRSKGEENNFGYDELFPGVALALAGADLAIANLEFPILKEHKPARPFIFSGDPNALRAAMRAGFTAFTLANNHSYDQSRSSPASTARLCRQEQAVCLGVGENREEAEAPLRLERNGIRLAVIGYSEAANDNLNSQRAGAPHVNGYAFGPLLEQVRAAAAGVDCVVVAVHWGEEYRPDPLPAQREQARELAEAGACLILGSHPHVLEPIEEIRTAAGRRALVAYSLGNFVSNQERPNPAHVNRLGAILRVELERGAAGVEPAAWEAVPIWTNNVTVYLASRSYEDLRVVVLPATVKELEDKLAAATEPAEKAELTRDLAFYRGRIADAERILVLPRGPVAAAPGR